MKMIKLFSILFMINFTLQCDNGCINCREEEKTSVGEDGSSQTSIQKTCIFCDMVNGFSMIDGKCQFNDIKPCRTVSFVGTCLNCQKDYYLDSETLKCVEVSPAKIKDQCLYYDQQQICSICQAQYLVKDQNCVQINNTIDNCLVHMGENLCQQCDKQYLLDLSQRSCIPITDVEQCASYSQISCTQCAENSIMDPSYLNDEITRNALNPTDQNKQWIYDLFLLSSRGYLDHCARTTVDNCKTFTDYKTCSVCKTGFHLEDNTCKQDPTQFTANCDTYVSFNECKTCVQGYWLQGPTQCSKVTIQPLCDKYFTGNIDKCVECESTHFLETENTCSQRQNTDITDCATYNADLDQCFICSTGTVITDDNLKCLPQIDNCKTYGTTSQSSTVHTCTKCSLGFYISGTNCSEGTKENCSEFQTQADLCQVCNNGFYLSNNNCLAHDIFSGCLTYSNNTQNTCDVCQVGTQQMVLKTKCNKVTLVEGCATYSNTTTCATCEDHYDFVGGVCESLSSGDKCLRRIEGVCQMCKSNYFKDGVNVCQNPLEIGLQLCDTKTLNTDTNYNECNICSQNSVSYNYNKNHVCITQPSAEEKGFTITENCLQHTVEGNDSKCNLCNNSKFLSNDRSQCVDECQNETIQRFVGEQIDGNTVNVVYRNKCTNQVLNCDAFSPLLNDINGTYCVQCSSGMLKKITIDQNPQKRVLVYDEDVQNDFNLNFYSKEVFELPEIDCSIELNLITTNSNDSNCDYWYSWKGERLGCLKCNHKYHGLVKNWGILNCKEYDSATKTCLKCKNQFTLAVDKMSCTLTIDIDPKCIWVQEDSNTCQRCEQLDDQTAFLDTPVTCLDHTLVLNCKTYKVDGDECVECDPNFIFNIERNLCYKKIDNCIIHQNITDNQNPSLCLQCKDGYYPGINDDGDNNCVEGKQTNCWQYDQELINTCVKYVDQIKFSVTKECVNTSGIEGCVLYSDVNVCQTCDSNEYYKSGNVCCRYSQFYNEQSSQCELLQINNCKTGVSAQQCNECESEFYDDMYQAELTPPFMCCSENSYWHPTMRICTNLIDLSLAETNQINCDVFNPTTWKCETCKTGYYKSNDFEICCLSTEYLDDSLNCISITAYPNCVKIRDSKYADVLTDPIVQCQECSPGYVLDNNICCLPNQTADTGVCVDIVDQNCEVYDVQNGYCTSCKNGFYHHINDAVDDLNRCCAYGQYFSGDCIDVTVTDCSQQKDLICVQCVNGSSLNFAQNLCISDGNLFIPPDLNKTFRDRYDNCTQIDFSLNTCTDCLSNHTLTDDQCVPFGKYNDDDLVIQDGDIDNCNVYTTGTTHTCTTCQDGYLPSVDSLLCEDQRLIENLITIPTLTRHCKWLNVDYTGCNTCNEYSWMDTGQIFCCGANQENYNDVCQDISTDCINRTDAGCQLSSPTAQDSCLKYGLVLAVAKCLECKKYFILDENNDCQDRIPYYISRFPYQNCLQINTISGNCTDCFSWAYLSNDQCCPFGYTFVDFQCRKNSIKNCAVQTGLDCTECFYTKSFQSISQSTLVILPQNPILMILTAPHVDQSYFQPTADNKYCCPEGSIVDTVDNICKPADIADCKWQDEAGTCVECTDGFYLVIATLCCPYGYEQNGVECSLKSPEAHDTDCSTGKYFSFGHCCIDGTYWDLSTNKCETIQIKDCSQMSDNGQCSVCDVGTLSNNFLTLQKYVKKSPLTEEYLFEFEYLPCFDSTGFISNTLVDSLNENCFLFDQVNHKCQTCNEGYNLDTEIGKCCQNGQSAQFYRQSEYVCIDFSIMRNNCAQFTHTTLECENCLPGYHKSGTENQCCVDGMEFDVDTMTCSIKNPNCIVFDLVSQQCARCLPNTYRFEGICVREGKIWSNNNEIDIPLSNCLRQNIYGDCVKAESGDFYLIRGRACPYLQFYDFSSCVDFSTLGNMFSGFKTATDTLQATACTESQYVSNGMCVDEYTYYHPELQQVLSIYKYQFCSKIPDDLTSDCLQCSDSYYLNNGFCQPQGFITSQNVSGIREQLNDVNCLEAADQNTCTACNDNHVLVQGSCLTDPQQGKNNCAVINGSTCTSCRSNHYLSQGYCCPFGQFSDGGACQAIDNAFVNCEQFDSISNKCLTCTDPVNNLLLPDQSACCPTQKQYENSACADLGTPITDCMLYLPGVCVQCIDGKELVTNTCIDTTITDCKVSFDGQCTICNDNFELINATTCTAVNDPDGTCLMHQTNTSTCISCDNTVLYQGGCIIPGQITVQINQSDVDLTLAITGIPDRCNKVTFVGTENVCITCEDNLQPADNNTDQMCCAQGEKINNGACEVVEDEGLKGCKQFNTDDSCKKLFHDSSCMQNYSWLEKEEKCCLYGNYFDGTNCVQNNPGFLECDELNTAFECNSCRNSNLLTAVGQCCSNSETSVGGICLANPRNTACSVFDGKNCLSCQTGILDKYNLCCSQFYETYSKSCIDIAESTQTSITETFNKATCSGGKQFAINSKGLYACCTAGQTFDGTDCQDGTLASCLTPNALDDKCLVCQVVDNEQLIGSNSICYTRSQILTQANDIVIETGISNAFSLIKTWESGTEFPTTCSGTLQTDAVNSNYCCPMYNISVETTPGELFTCTPQNAGDDFNWCLNYDFDQSFCTQCDSNLSVLKVESGSECCDIQFGTNQTDCLIEETDETIKNCMSYDASNSCSICSPGYNLQSIAVLDVITALRVNICCKDGSIYIVGYGCVNYGHQFDTCKEIDQQGLCTECISTLDGQASYLAGSDNLVLNTFKVQNGFCCPEDTFFPTRLPSGDPNQLKGYHLFQESTCISVKTDVHIGKCVQYDNDLFKCYKCQHGYYLSQNSCCREGFQDSDDTTVTGVTCQQILEMNCLQFTTECTKCETGFELVNDAKCCRPGNYFNTVTSLCSEILIDNCKTVDGAPHTTCVVCQTGYQFSNGICCPSNSFYNQVLQECQPTFELNDNIKKFDRKAFAPFECMSGYYLSRDVCVEDGYYQKISSGDQEQIDPLLNCKQLNRDVDEQNMICLACNVDYDLKSDDNTCISRPTDENILTCDEYDTLNSQCTSCKSDEFYLSDFRCVPLGKIRLNDSSTDVGITGCLKQNDDNLQCDLCDDSYYMNSDNTCCLFNTYYDFNQQTCETATIQNCKKEILQDPPTCEQCDQNFMQIELDGGIQKCIQFRETSDICVAASYLDDVEGNYLVCTECKSNLVDFIVQDLPQNEITTKFIQYGRIQGCDYYQNKVQLSTSDFQCLKCENNNLQWLNLTICEARTVKENCVRFHYTADECLECSNGYSLNDITKACDAYPTDCSVVNNVDASICEVCIPPKIMIKNENVLECVDISTITESQEQTPNPDFFLGYIEQCVENEECTSEYKGGLKPELSRIFSCHKCIDQEKIPFVSFRGFDDPGVLQFSGLQRQKTPENNEDRQDLGAELFSSTCLKKNGEFFGIDKSNFKIPNNCSLGLINSNAKALASDSHLAEPNINSIGIYCAACDPGFYPSYSDNFSHVYQCDQIQQCKTADNNFNECDECEENYVFLYDDIENMVDRTKCVLYVQDQNCYSADTNEVCIYCKEGFSKNYDEICEPISPLNCKSGEFNQSQYTDLDPRTTMIRTKNGIGCKECEADFHQIWYSTDTWFCSMSPFVQSQSFLKINPNYQQNCLNYESGNDQLNCSKCNFTTVLDTQGQCIDKTNISNCILAVNTNECMTCETNFTRVNNLCVLKEIDNCALYIDNPSGLEPKCARCEDNYGLRNNLCVANNINPCLQINDDDICIICSPDHNLTTLQDEITQCIPVSSHMNCGAFDQTEFNTYNLKCNTCVNDDYLLETLNSNSNVCNQIVSITKCVQYDQNSQFDQSTLLCQLCEDGYYLDVLNNTCVLNNNKVENCLVHETTSPLCSTCKEGFFIQQDQKACIRNLKGVFQCRIYQSESVCLECNAHYYIKDGKCENVTTQIVNCITYDIQQNCIKCESSSLLQEGQCNSLQYQNCEVPISVSECETCLKGFTLTTENSVSVCNEIVQSITNCQSVIEPQLSIFDCELCDDGYYKESVQSGNNISQCKEVTNKILNCKSYETSVVCSQCERHFTLRADKKACVPLQNTNCYLSIEETQSFCSVCLPHYNLVEGQCTAITGDYTKNENCLVFEQEPVEGKLRCLWCFPEFSMTEVGVCTPTTFPGTVGDGNGNDQEVQENTLMNSVFLLILIFIFEF